MRKIEAVFGCWIVDHRWWVIVSTLMLLAIAGSGLPRLYFTNDHRVFFSAENPELLAFESLERTYTKDDNVFIVVAPKDGDILTRKSLEAVEWLTEEAWQTPLSTRVDSITNFQHTEAEGDNLIVRNLVEDAASLSSEELLKIRSIALSEPMLVDRLVPLDAAVTAINITVQFPDNDHGAKIPLVVKHSRDLSKRFEQRYPDFDVYLTGVVFINNAFMEASQNDMKTLVMASFGLMFLVLGLLLRGVLVTMATILVVLFSIITAMGIGGHFNTPISPPSAISPSIIMTMAIASSVHFLVSFLFEMKSGAERNTAIIESLRVNLQPIVITSLTTALGFLSMNFSEAPPFRHLGNLVAVGVLASLFYTTVFLPALASLLPIHVKQGITSGTTAMERLAEFVISKRRYLLWISGSLIVVLISFIPRNELNDVFTEYFDSRIEFRVHNDFLDEHLSGLYRIDYSLDTGEPGGISEPEFLQSVERFSEWWRAQPKVVHVNTYTDIMKRLNKNLHADDPAWYTLPAQRDLAAQYLLLYELSLPRGLDLNNQLSMDKSATRITVSLKTISSTEVLDLEQRASQWITENEPLLQGSVGTGTSIMFSHIGKRNIKSMLMGTTLALVLISMILIVVLRSFKIGLLSMIPNLAPIAIGFGLWGLIVGEVGLALSIVSGMTLGIVVDDTVHFLSKYLRAKREHKYDAADAVRYAFSRVGKALWITSAVLIVGFLILSLSSFKLNSDMGLLTAIVIAIALIADFLFLPSLLMKIEKNT